MKLTKNLKIAANPAAIVKYMTTLVKAGTVDLVIAFNATEINIVGTLLDPVSGNASFHDCWRELRRQLTVASSEYVTEIRIRVEPGTHDWVTRTVGKLYAMERECNFRNLRGESIRELP